MRLLHATLRVALIASLLLLTGCPPQRFPFEDRWEQIVPTVATQPGFEEELKSIDPKLAEAVMQSLADPSSDTPRQLHFRMDGTFVETVTIGGQPSAVEGQWKYVSQKKSSEKGEEYQIEMTVGPKPMQSNVRLTFPNRDVMVLGHALGVGTVTVWKRMK